MDTYLGVKTINKKKIISITKVRIVYTSRRGIGQKWGLGNILFC